jgi:hypothetical protein
MPKDWIVREDHPFDRGYWLRFDGMPKPIAGEFRRGEDGVHRPIDAQEEAGWIECDNDKRFEAAQLGD